MGILLPTLSDVKYLYHGTTVDNVENISRKIEFEKCKLNTDFGRGFYLTADKTKAEHWASVRAAMRNQQGAVLVYGFNSEKLLELKGKEYPDDSLDWKQFVFNNRTNRTTPGFSHNLDSKYDYVWGAIADGNTGLIKKAVEGEISETDFYSKMGSFSNQISIHTSNGLDLICKHDVYRV